MFHWLTLKTKIYILCVFLKRILLHFSVFKLYSVRTGVILSTVLKIAVYEFSEIHFQIIRVYLHFAQLILISQTVLSTCSTVYPVFAKPWVVVLKLTRIYNDERLSESSNWLKYDNWKLNKSWEKVKVQLVFSINCNYSKNRITIRKI